MQPLCEWFVPCKVTMGLVLQASPILFCSTDRFQYRHAEEESGDLGPLYMNSCNTVIGQVTYKACNLLHTPHPLNDFVLATCGESYCTLFVWVLYYGFMDDKSYVGHWDGTDKKPDPNNSLPTHLLNILALSVTRNKCCNDLAHVTESTLIMCSALSLALFKFP